MNLSLAARYGVFDALERADAGSLRIIAPDGAHLRFGAGGPEAEIAIRDWRTLPALLARGDIGFGEAYAEGWWESPDLETLFAFGLNNQHALGAMLRGSPWSR
ncbi:MAG: SAM-dependent methyltransferase, partial [Hyphomonadaceae bacterium]